MRTLQILIICLAVGTSWCDTMYALLHNTDRNLLQLMVDARYDQRSNPEQNMACFDYYMKVFEELNEQYKQSYSACLATSSDKRAQIDASTQPKRDAIEDLTFTTCAALENCALLSDSVSYFGCFAKNGKQSTEDTYKISADATETLAEVSESYQLIDNEENRCTNASGRAYVENTYQTSEDLQSCLRGETTVPATTSTPPSEGAGSTIASRNAKSSLNIVDEFLPADDLALRRYRRSKPNRKWLR